MNAISSRPAHATEMIGAQESHAEALDPSTGQVWQSLGPISAEAFRTLTLPEGWIRVGLGTGAMDEHWFERSPGRDEDGPMETRDIDGHCFGFCARPLSAPLQPAGPDGPRQLRVDKHHALRFARGRSIPLLRLPDGQRFVHVVEGGRDKPTLALPKGWELESVTLARDWVVRLPTPTTVFFFPNRDSYQGPIEKAP